MVFINIIKFNYKEKINNLKTFSFIGLVTDIIGRLLSWLCIYLRSVRRRSNNEKRIDNFTEKDFGKYTSTYNYDMCITEY